MHSLHETENGPVLASETVPTDILGDYETERPQGGEA